MSFANMSPADRMKASGLIGLIVVILFFVVRTILGAVSPAKPANAVVDNAAPPAVAAPPAPGAGPSQTAPLVGDGAFPMDKVTSAPKNGELAHSLSTDVPDPFVPINDPKAKENQPAKVAKAPEPSVELKPVFDPKRPVGNVPPDSLPYGPGPTLPSIPQTGGSQVAGGQLTTAPIAPPKIEPEIKVIGVVDGDPPVATLQVAGRTVVARRGDALATGYRIMDISPEGVVVRCGKEHKSLRVGSVINEPSASGK